MSTFHLDQLEKTLERNHWRIVERHDGDDYRYSGAWQIARPDGSNQLHILFEGLDDLNTLPMEQAYGCVLAEAPSVGLYFSRKGRSWEDNLQSFIRALQDSGRKDQ